MAEFDLDDLDSVLEEAFTQAGEGGSTDESSELLRILNEEKPTSRSGEDTPNVQGVQAQHSRNLEKTGFSGGGAGSTRRKTVVQSIVEEEQRLTLSGFNRTRAKRASDQEVIHHLAEKHEELQDLMAWKEELSLMAVNEVIPANYSRAWTKEANLFFLRVVIIRRRLANLKKQKGLK